MTRFATAIRAPGLRHLPWSSLLVVAVSQVVLLEDREGARGRTTGTRRAQSCEWRVRMKCGTTQRVQRLVGLRCGMGLVLTLSVPLACSSASLEKTDVGAQPSQADEYHSPQTGI